MIDRANPPGSAPVRPFSFPDFSSVHLDNGLRILTAPQTRVPLVLLRLLLPAGAENDLTRSAGLAALTAALLDEGTETRSSFDLAAAAEQLGGYVASGATWDASWAETSLLARDLETGLELLADVVMRPIFPEHEVARLQQQTIGHLRRRRMQPAAAANDAFNHALYTDSPYALPLLGTERTIEAIHRDQALSFFRQRVLPEGATLVAVGDMEPGPFEQAVAEAFGTWRGRAPDPPEIPSPQRGPGPRVVIVDRPDAPQSEICVGHAGIGRDDPDYLTFSVLNTLLGGKFTSRINLNLRERHGFTYGAHSRLAARRGPGPFTVSAAVDNEAVTPAVKEILGELERLRDEPVAESEVGETIDYILGSFPYTCETLAGVAARLGTIAVHHLPDDYYRTLPRALRAIDAEAIQRCARAHLHPEDALVVVAGPADVVASPLGEIAPPELAGSR